MTERYTREAVAFMLLKREFLSDIEKNELREMFDSASRAFDLDCDNIELEKVQKQIESLIH